MRTAIFAACAALTWPGIALAADGAKIYAETCQACHQVGGVGSPGLAPPLVSPVLSNAATKRPDYPAMVIINGLSGTLPLEGGETITSAMPPQPGLNDEATAAVVNYVFRLNRAKVQLKSADVARTRSHPVGNDEIKQIRSGLTP
ncbi:cytochrome c [Bradyrhizobium sp. 83012]|uniref:Cytochrome c n=1 Tax=Bradyrhizobium aeschynomenes TaxID=2734909 RepID=A0ABX2CAX3_9BRAD|nr:cytochrome c [Bradyrhizobium aeschynomenes]NPU64374.1 cytochrome c [Bradyrhizobium aeschynomenes]